MALAKLKVPSALPNDIKTSLEEVKGYLSTGFGMIQEGMNYFAQYIVNRNPILYDRYIEKRDEGILYIDGGLTSLATVRLKFGPPEWIDAPKIVIPNAWKVGKWMERLWGQSPNGLNHYLGGN